MTAHVDAQKWLDGGLPPVTRRSLRRECDASIDPQEIRAGIVGRRGHEHCARNARIAGRRAVVDELHDFFQPSQVVAITVTVVPRCETKAATRAYSVLRSNVSVRNQLPLLKSHRCRPIPSAPAMPV